ncbi:MAG TPA: carboxypeptidase regulatory-like domain-containing protein [Candidatus Acidoferrales bacterium]
MNPAALLRPGAEEISSKILRALTVCAIAIFFGWARPAAGQVFQLTGGSSSLLDAEGGSLEVHADHYTARIDLGYLGRPSLGFFVSRPYKTAVLGVGDQQIPFLLPTDLFDTSYYFLGRGMSLTRNVAGNRLFIFAGGTTDGYFAPFLNVARGNRPSGAIFYERQLSPTVRLFSRNVFSDRQSSIQAIEWLARKDIKMALSAGIGNNQPYGATSFTIDKHWAVLDASYALAGHNFQRILVATSQLSENDRENIRLELRPATNARIVISRNNYLSSFSPNEFERATVEGLGASASLGGFQWNGSLFKSSTTIGNSSAADLGVRRMVTRHVEAGADFLRSTYSKGTPTHSVIGNIREILNSRFSVTQIISHNNGQTNVDFGGSFVSNLVTVNVDYQTLFLPFVPSAGGQFKQVMVLSLHFQLPHGVQFNMDTDVTPLGQVRYTAYGSTYAYRGLGRSSSGTSFTGSFFKNTVRGQVLDPDGEPIAGAALQIGTELAVTDSDGNFMVRVKKGGELSLKVAFDEFTSPGKYVIVQAPQTVKATRQDSAQEYSIVLRRLPNGVSSADPSHQPDSPDLPTEPK